MNDLDEVFVKDFDGWIDLKKNMDKFGRLPTINEGEVWWCGVGTNVGVEISGKGRRYARPVLILKKLSSSDGCCWPSEGDEHVAVV